MLARLWEGLAGKSKTLTGRLEENRRDECEIAGEKMQVEKGKARPEGKGREMMRRRRMAKRRQVVLSVQGSATGAGRFPKEGSAAGRGRGESREGGRGRDDLRRRTTTTTTMEE